MPWHSEPAVRRCQRSEGKYLCWSTSWFLIDITAPLSLHHRGTDCQEDRRAGNVCSSDLTVLFVSHHMLLNITNAQSQSVMRTEGNASSAGAPASTAEQTDQ